MPVKNVVNSPWSRAIVLTPRYGGADGVSAVTRAYVDALMSTPIPRVDVWTLDEEPGSGVRHPGSEAPTADDRSQICSANGQRLVFASYGLREWSVDNRTLVIVQHVHLLPTALPLVARGARLLAVLHGIEAWTRLRPLERAAMRRAWKIAAVSAHTARRFRDANRDFAGIPIEVCAPGLPEPAAVPHDRVAGPYALIVARMNSAERYKGHDELLEVWPAVRAKVPQARLVVAGGGDDRARLEQKAASLSVAGAVRFEGVVDERRLQALYRSATVFAMPSPNEGFGLVYVEAMRAGIPCIVCSGAAEEIVDHERTGLVVPPRDRALLERALVRLLTGDDERARMGAAATAACRRFTAEAFRARVAALLDLADTPVRVMEESNVPC
jgi:phosphatidylinositol alpha-1,6-mannosyltransferase